MKTKILIVKLGAKGDVVRTLPLAEAMKTKYKDSEITWITKQNTVELLEGNPFIDKILNVNEFNIKEKFDILYNFDIEEEATNIAESVSASKKYGFYSEQGYTAAFNLGAEYYLNTLFDDEIKKTNRKTHQEMMFAAAELTSNHEKSKIYLNEKDKQYADKFLEDRKIDKKKLIGIHMGAASRWPSKVWSEIKLKEFIIKAKEKNYEVLIFGGPNEINKIDAFVTDLKSNNIKIHKNNPHNSDKQFCSLVSLCTTMVCSDSFALHISLAMQKKTIALFFCTPPNEVESYGLLTKLVSPMLYEFFPEKMDQYDEKLVNSISAEQVLSVLASYGE